MPSNVISATLQTNSRHRAKRNKNKFNTTGGKLIGKDLLLNSMFDPKYSILKKTYFSENNVILQMLYNG